MLAVGEYLQVAVLLAMAHVNMCCQATIGSWLPIYMQ
jgi:hypothetical protein